MNASIVIGSIRYRMEIRFVEAYSKYASNNNGSITTQLDYHVVHVAVDCMQGKQIRQLNCRVKFNGNKTQLEFELFFLLIYLK